MRRPVSLNMTGMTAGAANNIALSQTPGAAGNLTLAGSLATGGVATLDVARRVSITSAGSDESGKTFTLTGTDRNGVLQSETVTGPGAGATVFTLKDYKTITQIAVSAATTGAVTAGTGSSTTGKLSSQWLPTDRTAAFNLGFSVIPTGTINYSIEYTYDDPYAGTAGVQGPNGAQPPYLNPLGLTGYTAQTGAKDGAFSNQPIAAIRVTINSFSAGAALLFNLAPGPFD